MYALLEGVVRKCDLRKEPSHTNPGYRTVEAVVRMNLKVESYVTSKPTSPPVVGVDESRKKAENEVVHAVTHTDKLTA